MTTYDYQVYAVLLSLPTMVLMTPSSNSIEPTISSGKA
jgi:hypothetical protein